MRIELNFSLHMKINIYNVVRGYVGLVTFMWQF